MPEEEQKWISDEEKREKKNCAGTERETAYCAVLSTTAKRYPGVTGEKVDSISETTHLRRDYGTHAARTTSLTHCTRLRWTLLDLGFSHTVIERT